MGKVEDLRAIKDARFAAAQKPVAVKPVAVKPVAVRAETARPMTTKPSAPAQPPVVATTTPAPAASLATLCGHRAIGGKTCIREKGHDEASHKYAKS